MLGRAMAVRGALACESAKPFRQPRRRAGPPVILGFLEGFPCGPVVLGLSDDSIDLLAPPDRLTPHA